MDVYTTKKYDLAYKYLIDSIENNVRLREETYEKFFAMYVNKYNTQKKNIKLDCVQKAYSMLRDKNVKLSEDAVRKILHFIWNDISSPTIFYSY